MSTLFSSSSLLPGLRERIDGLAPAHESVRGRVVAIQGVTVRAMLPIASMGRSVYSAIRDLAARFRLK